METKKEAIQGYNDWRSTGSKRDAEASGDGEEANTKAIALLTESIQKRLEEVKPQLENKVNPESVVVFSKKVVSEKSRYMKTLRNWCDVYKKAGKGQGRVIVYRLIEEMLSSGLMFYTHEPKKFPGFLIPIYQVEKIKNRMTRDFQRLVRENDDGGDFGFGPVGSSISEGGGEEDEDVEGDHQVAKSGGEGEAATKVATLQTNPPVPQISVPKTNTSGNVARSVTGDDVSSIHEVSTGSSLVLKNDGTSTPVPGTDQKSTSDQATDQPRNTFERGLSVCGTEGEPEPWEAPLPQPKLTILESWSRRQLSPGNSNGSQEGAAASQNCKTLDAAVHASEAGGRGGGSPGVLTATGQMAEQQDRNKNEMATATGAVPNSDDNVHGDANSAGKRKTRQEDMGTLPPPKRESLEVDQQFAGVDFSRINSFLAATKVPGLGSPSLVGVEMEKMSTANVVPLLPRPLAASFAAASRGIAQDMIQVGKPAAMPAVKDTFIQGQDRQGQQGFFAGVEPSSLLFSESIATIPRVAGPMKPPRRTSTKSAPPSTNSSAKKAAAVAPPPTSRGRVRSAPQGRSSRAVSTTSRRKSGNAASRGAAAGRTAQSSTSVAARRGGQAGGRNDTHFSKLVTEMMDRLQGVELRLITIESQNRRFRQRLTDLEREEEIRADATARHSNLMTRYLMESADASYEHEEGGARPEDRGDSLPW